MSEPLIISQDAALLSQVQSSAAAADLGLCVCDTSAGVRRAWAGASLVIVGVDRAAMVAGLGLPARGGVHVIGLEAETVLAWSVPLAAPGLVLPRQAGFLAALLDEAQHPAGAAGTVLRVFGASGGLGASTLAAGLAVRAARRGGPVALVELCPLGGGLDVMMGAEHEAGWRWGDLAAARGHVGDLTGHLPAVRGVDIVAASRRPLPGDHLPAARPPKGAAAAWPGSADDQPVINGPSPNATIPPEAMTAVLASLRRTHELIIIDQGRLSPGHDETVLLVGADVRAVLAAQAVVGAGLATTRQVVARTGPGRRLPPDLIADSLGRPVIGSFPHDARLPGALEAGDPPGRARGHTSRALDRLLDRLLPDHLLSDRSPNDRLLSDRLLPDRGRP